MICCPGYRQHPAVVAQADRARAEVLHRALVITALDVFPDAEGIVEQVDRATRVLRRLAARERAGA